MTGFVRSFRADLLTPLFVLTVGGGPDLEHNEASIERHVRWVDSLVPAEVPRTVLFADGDPASATVEHRQRGQAVYRAPELPRIDGPSTLAGIDAAWPPPASDRVLLYFAGHGREEGFSLWGGKRLSVPALAHRIAKLPEGTGVVVVMAQCHSGVYGDLLFKGGKAGHKLVEREVVGFFATVAERTAAGCTSSVNERGYADFTTFFFTALTGADRGGRKVNADIDGDGAVGMDEAYAWTLVNDTTIDVPVSTSDVFLRRFADVPVAEAMQVPWSSVVEWATPAQRSALDGLSRRLGLDGEDRLAAVFAEVPSLDPQQDEGAAVPRPYRMRLVQVAWSVVLAHHLDDPHLRERFERLRAAEAEVLW